VTDDAVNPVSSKGPRCLWKLDVITIVEYSRSSVRCSMLSFKHQISDVDVEKESQERI